MNRERFWVRFISKWTKDYKILSFDTEKEALWFKSQVDGESFHGVVVKSTVNKKG